MSADKMKQCIAYEGSEFTVEWYFDEKGKSQALDYFNKQTDDKKRKAYNLFKLMADFGKIHDKTKFRNEDDGIYAFKPQPDRYLCFFFRGKKIIVTNAFQKKADKLPAAEKERALQSFERYEYRIKKGIYYEEES